ncbi:MAG TPA: hypothetical protein VFV08_07735, partial [Puia sp.]|nr:hypothetical protein [Puia sp.]
MTKDYFLPVVSKAAVNSFTLIDWDLAAGKIDLNQATTYKIYALFQSPLLPTQYLSDVPLSSDSSGALYSTLSNWGQLNANTQQTLTDFLTPQVITSSGSSGPQTIYGRRVVGCDLLQSKVTTHFIIWYSGIDPRCASGVTDVYVANLATGFEDAWTKYYTLGYTEPVTTNVYLVPLIKRITNADAISWPLGIFFDHDLSDNILNLQAIAAHEFFHQVQLQYFAASCPKYPLGAPWNIVGAWVDNEDVRWWMDSTAQWAQHEVYTSDKSYFRPIPSFLNQTWQHLDTRLIFINVDPKGLAGFPYGTVLFPIYLSERLPAQGTLIKNTWEKYSQLNNGCGAMMPALQSALQTQGTSMELVFPGFSEANYSLAYQNQNDFRNDPTFGVGASYKPWTEIAALWEDLLFQHGPTTGTGRDTVEHLGTAYIELDNRFSNGIGRALTVTADIYLSSSLTTTVDPVVKVWAINQYTPTIISKTIIPNFQFITQTGSTKHYVAKAGVPGFDGSKWVTMMLVNTQTS